MKQLFSRLSEMGCMSKTQRRTRSRSLHSLSASDDGPRLVAMSLAQELSAAVRADPREHQDLVDAALSVGQWLADQGLPGRWDRIRPAQVLRCLDFLQPPERERFLFSLVGLVGHAALLARIPAAAAIKTLDETAALAESEVIRVFARTTAARLATFATRADSIPPRLRDCAIDRPS
jgi:hypothetical protein